MKFIIVQNGKIFKLPPEDCICLEFFTKISTHIHKKLMSCSLWQDKFIYLYINHVKLLKKI